MILQDTVYKLPRWPNSFGDFFEVVVGVFLNAYSFLPSLILYFGGNIRARGKRRTIGLSYLLEHNAFHELAGFQVSQFAELFSGLNIFFTDYP